MTDANSGSHGRRWDDFDLKNSPRQIVVRDRKGMEGIAAESYGVPEAEYRRLMS
jgi:hypothetical protein